MLKAVKRYAILGVAGFVAPRHLAAIKVSGGECVAACDPHDSVGILDSYFPACQFFTEFGRFERFLEKEKLAGNPIDYLVICSPNYLHDSQVRFGLRYGCDVICEKPLAINPHNVRAIIEAEKEYGKAVWSILQMRLHPSYTEIKKLIESVENIGDVALKYHAPRGSWYHASWKGDETKSGGILMNIGVHFFDLLIQFFGDSDFIEINEYTSEKASGNILFTKARVNWTLDISQKSHMEGYRGLEILGKTYNFTDKMKDLHMIAYQQILSGKGNRAYSVLPSIELVAKLRDQRYNQVKNVSF